MIIFVSLAERKNQRKEGEGKVEQQNTVEENRNKRKQCVLQLKH